MRRWPLALCLVGWALPAPLQAQELPPEGSFVDRDGVPIDAQLRYDAELRYRDPVHLRVIVEEGIVLGAGALWYALDERNLADWDFPSWQQRFSGEAWRMDNNHFPINFIAHPLNGGAFYALPRLNDHGLLASSAYALATSFAWEFLIEFREKVSVNDLIVTLGAGIPIGELANKLWRYLNGRPKSSTTGQDVAAVGWGFPYWAHQAVDGGPSHPPTDYDEWGFSAAIGTELSIGYRARLHRWDGDALATHGITAHARLSTLPGEGRPGRYGLWFHDADVVDFDVDLGFGQGARELDLRTSTYLAGYYAQHVDPTGDGHALLVGADLAYRYRFQDFPAFNDRMGILHLPGLGADLNLAHGPYQLRARLRANGDFAGLHSHAYAAWAAQNVRPGDRPRSILRKHGYQYHWGGSGRLSAELRGGPVDLRLAGTLGAYVAQTGLDRAQDELTLDPPARDELFESTVEVGFTVPGSTFRIGGGWTGRRRRSKVGNVAVERDLSTWTVGVQARK